MSNQNGPANLAAVTQELNELRSRLEWLEEDRRKSNKRLAELDQRAVSQGIEIKTREQRIVDLESQLSKVNSQLSRVTQVDTALQQFREEMLTLIDQYDQRRILAAEELERLFRVQHEVTARELADVRKELPAIGRLRKDMELRQAEESRLVNMIGGLQTRIAGIDNRIESWTNDLSFIGENGKQNQRYIGELQASLLDINKRWEPINTRLDTIANDVSKFDGSLKGIYDIHGEVQRIIKEWTEKIQIGEYERNQQLKVWEETLTTNADHLEQFTREWVGFADQYKEAKMVLQTLAEFQRQLELQQHETNEVVRVETNRMQTRWDNFLRENEQRWQTFTVDIDQRWSVTHRDQKAVTDRLDQLDEAIRVAEQDKETLWRIQTAQADAMKLFPRVWLEEIEKAMAQNPNRRRQPALIPVREE